MRRHDGALRRSRHISHVHKFDIEDEIGLGGNAGVVRAIGNGAGSVGKLPGNEDAAFAADVHAFDGVVEAGDEAAHPLRKDKGRGIAQDGLAIGAGLGFAVLHHRLLVVFPGIEFDAVRGAPAGVLDVPELA